MEKEYDGQYKIIVRWYPEAEKLESRLIQLHKIGDHLWRSVTVYQAYPNLQEVGKKEYSDDDLLYVDPNEVIWLPRIDMTNINYLEEKTRQLTFKTLFEHQERLFKS